MKNRTELIADERYRQINELGFKPEYDAGEHVNSELSEALSSPLIMPFFLGKLLRKWDWWIYCRAIHSLRRMTLDNPGMAYLMELQMREWNEKLNISPELRRATELFHESMRDHSQQNA